MTDIERAIDYFKQELIEIPKDVGIDKEICEHCLTHVHTALAALQAQLDREREPNGWIKLSEGPPEEYTPVFIAVDGKRIGKGEIRHSLNGRYWYDFEMRGSIDFYSVTHWMPLPELPREE